ncbi:MAG TPA: hypothetical protein DCS07_06510 [Bdellovibrionales bacterium]|nr:hypothetical protein [Bdellovibrionales bacterium]
MRALKPPRAFRLDRVFLAEPPLRTHQGQRQMILSSTMKTKRILNSRPRRTEEVLQLPIPEPGRQTQPRSSEWKKESKSAEALPVA